jgi:hypothetical protein
VSKGEADLRGLFLATRVRDLGVTPSAELPNVWGGMMELAFPKATASLVSIADGSASLYLSTGGAVIGGQSHEPVRNAAQRFLSALEAAQASFRPMSFFPLPKSGRVSFVVRTYSSDLGAELAEGDLTSGGHPLSAAFLAGHDVIAALRLVAEKKTG